MSNYQVRNIFKIFFGLFELNVLEGKRLFNFVKAASFKVVKVIIISGAQSTIIVVIILSELC